MQQKQHRGGLPRGVQHINAHQHSCIQLVKQCCEAIKLNELMQPLNTAIEYGAERGNQRENQSWTSILALSRDGRHWPGILKSDAHVPSGQQSSPGRPHRGRCRGRSEDPCPAQLSLPPACDWPGQRSCRLQPAAGAARWCNHQPDKGQGQGCAQGVMCSGCCVCGWGGG